MTLPTSHQGRNMKLTKKERIEAARLRLEAATRQLRAMEIIWQDERDAAPNPFVRARDYCSAKKRAERKPYVDAWHQARDAYDALRERT